MTLHEALTARLGTLPVMTYANGYPAQALPKADLLALLTMHPDDPVATRDQLAAILDPGAFDDTVPRSTAQVAVLQWATRCTMAYEGADRLLAADVFRAPDADEIRALVHRASRDGEYCCPVGCGSGACEGCPCCVAGWCVGGNDGLPDGDPEQFAYWLDVAKDHNPLVAALVDRGVFDPKEKH